MATIWKALACQPFLPLTGPVHVLQPDDQHPAVVALLPGSGTSLRLKPEPCRHFGEQALWFQMAHRCGGSQNQEIAPCPPETPSLLLCRPCHARLRHAAARVCGDGEAGRLRPHSNPSPHVSPIQVPARHVVDDR